jgi:hypothetical protein
MINKQLSAINIDDIQYLIDNNIEESRIIEYKRELDGGKYGNSEFLADFVAFANSSGGDLVIGIEEGTGSDKGKPIAILGISIKNEDEDRLALNSTIRDKISPRFMDFQVHYIKLDNGNYIVVIRIKQSWNKPHMINNASRDFYIRNTAGKHAMDISEIRSSIFATHAGKERNIEFRSNRLLNIMSNVVNDAELGESSRIVLHVMPLSSFSEDAPSIPIGAMDSYWLGSCISHSKERLNYDGKFVLIDDGFAYGHIQLFRNGIIEYSKAVYTEDKKHRYLMNPDNRSGLVIKAFSLGNFKEVIERLKGCLVYLSENKVDTPICVSIFEFPQN